MISKIVASFLRGCHLHSTVSRELRIVLLASDLERTDMARVAKIVAALIDDR